MLSIKIYGKNRQDIIPVTAELRKLIKRVCLLTLYEEGYSDAFEVSVTLTDNEDIREINSHYRGIDRATDVLSFPMSEKDEDFCYDPDTGCFVLGDIVISLEKALTQAEEYEHSFKREVAFLTVHSMLHLLGYDHERSEEEEKLMFAKQDIVLEAMGLTQ